ncbi:hypothetical protein F4804DRAFT_262029 [Jackrogersella minutella]|nr:hypothetical protein F4804DRAFT_262029 [Jackrogersella minutella]
MQHTSQSSHTPNRRRQGGRHRNTPKSTTYASENDIPSRKPDQIGSPSTPALETLQSMRASSTSQKPRSKKKINNNNHNGKKPRNKDGAESIGHSNCSEQFSPTSFQSKDFTVPIFAGSTFHASPAPSALPIPSFLSSSEVDTPALKTTSSPEQGLSCPTTDSEEPSPLSPASIPRGDDSPLELLFRADRAEKARIRRASSAHADADATSLSPFSPPHESRDSPKECYPLPKATVPSQMRRPNNHKRPTVLGISADELDGDPRQPVGPAFSTPFHERMRAVRSNQNSAQSTPNVLSSQDPNSSDSLKRYLFTGRLAHEDEPIRQLSKPAGQTSQQNRQQVSQQSHKRSQRPDPSRRLPRGMFPASVLTANVQNSPSSAPPVEAHLAQYRPEQFSTMEDSLRRMLKLDSPSQSLSFH